MDASNDSATPRSGGSGSSTGSDGNGGRSANTSSRPHRRRMPSSPTGTQLMLEFNAAADAGGSGSSSSSSSSGALDLEGVLLIATPVATDSTIIMEGELLDDDNEPGTPSGTRRPASLVDNNGLGTSSIARRSTSVDNSGPSNRVSISDLDLVLLSSGSRDLSGGGSGGRRRASNDRFPQREEHSRRYDPRNNRYHEEHRRRYDQRNNRYNEVGSSRQQPEQEQWQGAGPSNIQIQPYQQGPELPPYPFHFRVPLPPGFRFPVPPVAPPPWALPEFAGLSEQVQLGPPVQGYELLPQYVYASPEPSIIYPPVEVTTARWPSGVTIRHPDGEPVQLPEAPARGRVVTITAPPASQGPRQPEQTAPSRATITAPPASERASSSSSAPRQPQATRPAPRPEQPEARASQPVPLARAPAFRWPPTAGEDALITDILYGPSRRPNRLPVFEEICPSEKTTQPPPPPPSP